MGFSANANKDLGRNTAFDLNSSLWRVMLEITINFDHQDSAGHWLGLPFHNKSRMLSNRQSAHNSPSQTEVLLSTTEHSHLGSPNAKIDYFFITV